MADWEEIKRLAADFQRAQLSSTAHKLSERNCVEIVQKLIHLGLIEVIYTTDGKEYLTPQQLEREIKDELFVHGGRINVVDLQQVEFSEHVKFGEAVRAKPPSPSSSLLVTLNSRTGVPPLSIASMDLVTSRGLVGEAPSVIRTNTVLAVERVPEDSITSTAFSRAALVSGPPETASSLSMKYAKLSREGKFVVKSKIKLGLEPNTMTL
ncbi:E3 UFM1-protein ligase 1-like protein [Acropora cervicornis]|uniref:E3 UFM1-protein ligase 1-like protein n=1 Tax=Acropora cervicornis TaxID=6130 RepID=A0AAD9PY47_ACRCE|nr:E3 UFM1-protein ligase 1-like protein [Acropora cervicornis]